MFSLVSEITRLIDGRWRFSGYCAISVGHLIYLNNKYVEYQVYLQQRRQQKNNHSDLLIFNSTSGKRYLSNESLRRKKIHSIRLARLNKRTINHAAMTIIYSAIWTQAHSDLHWPRCRQAALHVNRSTMLHLHTQTQTYKSIDILAEFMYICSK